MTPEDIERALAEHELAWDPRSPIKAQCACGWATTCGWPHDPKYVHRAHVADTIAAALGEREREALRQGLMDGWDRAHVELCHFVGTHLCICANPYARAVPHGE